MDKQRQLERLSEIEDGRWNDITKSLYGFVRYKAYDLKSGAFSEKNLGEPAVQHFAHEAIKKLWDCIWEWREDLPIVEQLKLIIVSMMNEAVRKYKQRGGKDPLTLNENIKVEAEQSDNSDFYEWLDLAADGDEELKSYVKAFKVCKTKKEIAQEMGVDISRVYNITKRIKRELDSVKALWIQ